MINFATEIKVTCIPKFSKPQNTCDPENKGEGINGVDESVRNFSDASEDGHVLQEVAVIGQQDLNQNKNVKLISNFQIVKIKWEIRML